MKITELKPVKDKLQDYEAIESRIIAAFKELVYYPILKEMGLDQTKLRNEKSALACAIEKGTVSFSMGRFSGNFNSFITKELKSIGAVWDKRSSTFKILLKDIPEDLRQVIQASEIRFLSRMSRVDRKLQQIVPADITEHIKTSEMFDRLIWKVDDELAKNAENFTVVPELTEARREIIAKDWQENMDKYIQNFTEKEIVKLRHVVLHSAMEGNRYEHLINGIQRSYGVTRRKAKFLARQETSLLIAKFKEVRYKEAGVYRYRWRCVSGTPAHPVRPAHKALNGQIFRFDDPPITTEPGQSVRRNNPGEDFNCRCTAIPIVVF